MSKISVTALGLALLMVGGCVDGSASPDLVSATGVSPQSVELGDTLQVAGRGFPEGVPARLSFHGDLFRAGKPPQRNVDIVVRTQDTSKDAISLLINDEVERAFCGSGDLASHATFRGDITVAFSARSAGMAPVTGRLRDVSLQVQPKIGSYQVERERQRVADEALKFLGLTLSDSSPTDCCTVLGAQGRALLAGLNPGDHILDFDGVTVSRASDLVPSGRNRSARLSIRREGAQTPIVRNIDVQGFRWTIPSELAPALACMLTVIGILIAWVSPIRHLVGTIAGAMARSLEEHRRTRGLGWARLRLSSTLRHCTSDTQLPEFASVRVAAVGSVVALGGLCTIMAVREELLSAELDLPLWWIGTTLVLALSSFMLSLAHFRGGFVKSLAVALHAIVHQVPTLALIISVILVTRTSRLADIVHAQSGWPQQWLLVHDPALAVSVILALLALVPQIADPRFSERYPAFATSAGPASSSAGLMSFVANKLHLWVQCVLLAMLVLGGWSVPGIEHTAMSSATKLLAIAGLLSKAFVLVAIVSLARWSLGTVRLQHTLAWTLRCGVPISILASVGTLGWNYCVRHWAITWADAVMHWVVLGLLSAMITLVFVQTRSRLRHSASLSVVSPWI